MKLTYLEINNFLGIGKVVLNLAERGLVAIQGVNNDDASTKSNGSAKSSLPDALCWVLYGVTARGETGDSIVNRTKGKDTKVELSIIDGNLFTVTRYRKHKTGKNALRLTETDAGGTNHDLTQGTDKLTQETAALQISPKTQVVVG